jgi:hypothetical protein
MKQFNEQQLQTAVERAGLELGIFQRIRAELSGAEEAQAGFEAAHIAYYLGALLIIGAMGWFVTDAWDKLSGITLFLVAATYALVFGWAGFALYRRAATQIPGGVLAAVAVCMTPLATFGIERQLGWWPADGLTRYSEFHPYISGSWVAMEIATILVAAIALKYVRFPFITAPAAYALWYLSMDATSFLFGKHWTFHDECWISVIFGLVMIGIAYFADGEADKDFAFWFYLFGVLSFSGGLSMMDSGSELGKAIYCLIHLAMIVIAVVLQRKVFLVFGAFGVFFYLAMEATHLFKDSLGFTIVITLIGIVFIVAGLLFKKNETAMTELFSPWIPERVRHRHPMPVA